MQHKVVLHTNEACVQEAQRVVSDYFTPEELAQHLGVPLKTIYRWRYLREGPPGFKVGRHTRFRKADVAKWVQEQMDRDRAAAAARA